MSFSWTLASQVILRVDMFRRLCSQKRISASSPFTLNVRNGDEKLPNHSRAGACSPHKPDIIPALEDSQQSHVVRKAAAREVPVDESEAFSVTDEGFWEAGGGGDCADGISNAAGRHTRTEPDSEANRPAAVQRAETD